MSWTSPSDLKREVQKWWDSGELLREQFRAETRFPRRLKLKAPSSGEMAGKFEELRSWISSLQGLKHYRVEMREINHRIFGKNLLPDAIWIDTIDSAIAIVGKRKEAARFFEITELTRSLEPGLVAWLEKKPLKALALEADWLRILHVLGWVKANPRPGIYLREVSLPGVDTKFIEKYREVIAECLDMVLPPEHIDYSSVGIDGFAKRFGFKEKRQHIRFRFLDPSCAQTLPAASNADLFLDTETFARLKTAARKVFITENEINYLSFPAMSESLLIFGSGYGFEQLSDAIWLFDCDIYYWGDIDTHGFAILSSLRSRFPQVQSILMDEHTLVTHMDLRSIEDNQHKANSLPYLTRSEQELYAKLKSNLLQEKLRLEQERIPWSYVCEYLNQHCQTSIYSNSGTVPIIVSTSDLSDFLSPTKCALRSRLTRDAAAGCEPNELQVLLGQAQAKFREEQLQMLAPNLVPQDESQPVDSKHVQDRRLIEARSEVQTTESVLLESALPSHSPDLTERHRQTMHAIEERQKLIIQPLLIYQTRIRDATVEIRAEADLLFLGENGYIARNFRLGSKSNSESSLSAIKLSMFTWVFRRLFPSSFQHMELLNSDGGVHELPHSMIKSMYHSVNQLVESKISENPKYEPVSWSKCSPCRFHSTCWDGAVGSEDVAVIPGVDQSLAIALHEQGTATIRSLTENFDSGSLMSFKRWHAGSMQKVGIKAKAILAHARALTESRHILMGDFDLELAEKYAIIDFEGLPAYLDSVEQVFLWGMQVFSNGSGPVEVATEPPGSHSQSVFNDSILFRALPVSSESSGATDLNGDADSWRKFLEISNSVFEQYGEIPFLHWHHYERTKLDLYMQRYGDEQGIAARVRRNLVDLLPLTKTFVALPIYSYSLKEIEKYVGFQRSLDVDGAWVISQMMQSIEGESQQEACLRRKLLAYNGEDIMATNSILQWLLELKDRA